MTGHSGFKGSWATLWLEAMGAETTGVSLKPDSSPALFDLALVERACRSVFADIRDADQLRQIVAEANPEIVIHMAAQALVRPSYEDPVATYATNVMGTVHLLDALRPLSDLQAVLIVTTDKVYENTEAGVAFLETDALGGHDPYSASKAAAEIVSSSWRRSFATAGGALLTARGGNVIGGGDFSLDRIVPDIWRAARSGETLRLRYPKATRPWQHVLDCVSGYFTYLQKAVLTGQVPHALNFGPDSTAGEATVSDVVDLMQAAMGAASGWEADPRPVQHEMSRLALDPSAAMAALGWKNRYDVDDALKLTADWYGAFDAGADAGDLTRAQIAAYCPGAEK